MEVKTVLLLWLGAMVVMFGGILALGILGNIFLYKKFKKDVVEIAEKFKK